MTVRKLVALAGAFLGGVSLVGTMGCAKKPTEHPFPKAAPTVSINGIQISGGVTKVFASGNDADGIVTYYRFWFDNQTEATSDSVATSTYTRDIVYGSMTEKHTAHVVCFDNDGLESKVAELVYTPNSVGTLNQPPVTELTSPVPGAVTSQGVKASFSGYDPDGFVAGYDVRFDDNDWTYVTTTTFSDSNLSVGGHTIQVRAVDNLGAYDPTPATAAFTVQAGLRPELTTSGITNGSTFFVPPGGTIDLNVGWSADASYYYGDVAGYAYDFDSTGISVYAMDDGNTFTNVGEGDHTIDVYAKDIAGNISEKTIDVSVVVPSLSKEVLVVNGVQWSGYGADMDATYPVFFAGSTPWDYWDLFGAPGGGYPSGMNVNTIGNGTGIGGADIGNYKAVLWEGNYYPATTSPEGWNADLMAGYIAAGGKLLLSTRRTIAYFNESLMADAHITGLIADLTGGFSTMQATASGAAIGMQDVTFEPPDFTANTGNTSAGAITGTDGSDLVKTLFVDGSDPSSILGVLAKAKEGDDWNIAVLCGRQYKVTSPDAMRDNYRKILADEFHVAVPDLP